MSVKRPFFFRFINTIISTLLQLSLKSRLKKNKIVEVRPLYENDGKKQKKNIVVSLLTSAVYQKHLSEFENLFFFGQKLMEF